MTTRAQQILWPAMVAVVLIAAWQGLVVAFKLPPFLVPSPMRVAEVMVADAGLLFGALYTTLKITLFAFVCAAVLGVLIVGVMIPAAPGMVGTFQYAVLLGLSLFVSQEALDVHGQAYAYVLWGAQLVQFTSFGLFFLFSRHIQIGRILHAPEELEEELEEEEQEYQRQEAPGAGAGKGR